MPTIAEIDCETEDASTVLSPKDASLLQHLTYLQRVYYQIDDIKNAHNEAPIVCRVFYLSSQYIALLYNYALQSSYNQDMNYDATAEYKQVSQAIFNGTASNRRSSRLCCLDDKPSISGEKLVFERRFLAALAFVCSGCPSLTSRLLDSAIDLNEIDVDMEGETGPASFVDLLAVALTNIAFLVIFLG